MSHISSKANDNLNSVADKYTSVIYGARERINSGLASLMQREDVQYAHSVGTAVYQQVGF